MTHSDSSDMLKKASKDLNCKCFVVVVVKLVFRSGTFKFI